MENINKFLKNNPQFSKDKDVLEIKKKLASLKSFTILNDNPVITTDFKGNLVELNKCAKILFPNLAERGKNHPYLSDIRKIVNYLLKERRSFRRYIKIGERLYKQKFYCIPEFKLIHIYGADATERKKKEEKIRKREQKYRSLFEKMNFGYALQNIIFDKNKKPVDYRFIDSNNAFERLLGIKKKQDLVGKTANQLAEKPMTEEARKNRIKYDNVAITGQPAYFENYNKKLNKYFDVYAYKPNKNQISVILQDVTGRKKMEEDKNNFIAILSHELRNPLTPILANTQLLIFNLSQQKNIDLQLIQNSILTIEKNAKIMISLLNDILDVSRLNYQKIHLDKKKINVCEAIRDSVEASLPFTKVKKQNVYLHFSQNPIYANADFTRIEQIVTNLVNNASKYTKEGGQIWVEGKVIEGQVHISVKDNGSGITKKKIKRIFELFNNEGHSFMGVGGLGIGLNIIRGLVKLHDGRVLVKSNGKNKGSEFIVTLPLAKKGPVQPIKKIAVRSLKPNAVSITSPLKILVVEDNQDIRSVVSRILESQGCQVKSTFLGSEAVKIYRTFKPHIALIDIGLPDMSGYKVAEALRKKMPKGKKTTLIAFTGYGQTKDKKLSKKSGFDYHLTKPVEMNQLLSIVKKQIYAER